MKTLRFSIFGVSAFLVLAMIVPVLKASDWDRSISLTFDSPIAIPGQVLPAGTYVFKTLNDTLENVVQIWNADQTQVLATEPAVPDQVARSYDKVVFTIDRSSFIPKLESFFYPGDNTGYQFNYSHRESNNEAQ